MKTLEIEVTIDEANIILEGLGQLPFVKVYELIAKIQQQASKQLNGQAIDAGAGQSAGQTTGQTTGPAPSIAE